jgi:hypothetical protein
VNGGGRQRRRPESPQCGPAGGHKGHGASRSVGHLRSFPRPLSRLVCSLTTRPSAAPNDSCRTTGSSRCTTSSPWVSHPAPGRNAGLAIFAVHLEIERPVAVSLGLLCSTPSSCPKPSFNSTAAACSKACSSSSWHLARARLSILCVG